MESIIDKLLNRAKEIEEKEDKLKSLRTKFLSLCDGEYGFEPEESFPSSYEMGVCDFDINGDTGRFVIYLRRPGILIGKQGKTIEKMEKLLECKIEIKEIKW